MARPGGQSDWSGPHHPTGTCGVQGLPPPEGCYNGCGETEGLFEFTLVFGGQVAGRWVLCGDCYQWGQQGRPLNSDPLTVGAA